MSAEPQYEVVVKRHAGAMGWDAFVRRTDGGYDYDSERWRLTRSWAISAAKRRMRAKLRKWRREQRSEHTETVIR